MNKPAKTDEMTKRQKKGAVEAAFAAGMEPIEMFRALLQNTDGIGERKGLIIHWARKMHIKPSDAFRIAHSLDLIPPNRQWHRTPQEKPPSKIAEKT
jgi:hypothetical protein